MRNIKIALLALLPLIFPLASSAAPVTTSCNDAPFNNVISHDLSFSYCELCGIGQVSILLSNPSNVTLDSITVTENLGASGLTHVAGSTTVSINGGGFVATGDPVVSGGSNQILTWTTAQIPALASMDAWINDVNPQPTIEIRFQVQRDAAFSEEGLLTASRLISASVDYNLNSCVATGPYTDITGNNTLPLREPNPVVGKLGRNVDAAQGTGNYSATVYGNDNDDVIWRVQVQNNGSAALEDLHFDDLMTAGNFTINYACPSETQATNLANNDGVLPGGSTCVASSNNITSFDVDDPFGNPGNDEALPSPAYVDVVNGGSAYIYLVGKITNSCNANTTNTVSNLNWGCEGDPTINTTTTSTGASPGSAVTTLSSLVTNNGLNVTRDLTGTNLAQPVGSNGIMTITITNNTGGTVKNIQLTDVLPTQYVVDPTFTPTLAVNPMYGNYSGIVNTINWTNPAPNTFPLTSSNPAEPLANTSPVFTLTSTTVHPDHPDQFNLLRNGDQAVVTFRVVMIEPTYFDKVADLDVRTENTGDGTDPNNATTLNNQLTVEFEQFCNPGVIQQPTGSPYNDTFPSNPEDLDVDITGTELVFILTNDPTQPLPLTVSVTNNGGHDAADYVTYVSFGATMDVITWPTGADTCVDISPPPPPLAVWEQPAPIPADATIFACTGPTIAPGATRTLNFEVIKTTDPVGLTADDLTFRADTVGQITLSDGTPLWFPTPDTSVIANSANNYTLDAIRARVVGFNLTKAQQGDCTENNPPPGTPDDLIQIGEECSVRIRTGGWFGFQTPGFTYIAVQSVQVVDELPIGQGYISSTDPTLTSDASILGISLNPPPAPLDEGWFDWTFNTVVPAERITTKDQWFQADVTTRMMNNPQNSSAAPNVHAATSTNILNSYFQAVFDNSGVEQVFNLGPSTIGYPQQAVRQVDLTVTEPNITVQKRVCNETLYGAGTGCTNFVATANDGDTFDSYIYRVTLTNGASSGGVARAPAYDISTTDILDASDLVYVEPFASDGLDNDGDGLIDGADLDGESTITDNVVNNAVPAQIDNSWTHSTALLRLDPGASVTFYYRVDPDQRVAPLQTLVNNVTASYDSLEGGANESSNQTVVLSATGDLGGARMYTSTPGTATLQIRPLTTQPKDVIATSNTTLGGTPQPVSIGEEVEYQLRAYLPVANLRSFVIQDHLPPGISCIEAPDIDLDALPYSAAAFSPGGVITPTCNATTVVWDFGDQELTVNATPGTLFEFPVTFIARVNNIAGNNEAGLISNGNPATVATVSYLDENLALQILNFAQNDLVVREPVIALTKTMEAANADASDILTVTVTATNNGTATAYNLRVFDDLAAVANLTYLGNVAGTDPPDNIDLVTFGANRPVFSWDIANPDFAIAPGATKSFTFDIQVDTPVQPLEVLDNTIQADWTSLPSQTTALNSSGTIGANGAADGMRNGALPNAGDPINDYETTAYAEATVPPVAVTKTDLNPALAPEIGAHKHFQLVLTFPEGVSNGVVVNDDLASTGLSYMLARDVNFDVSYTFNYITTINGVAPAEGAFNAVPVDGATGVITWDIGTVVTLSEDDTSGTPVITPSITIDYYARINNDLVTNVGGTLQNDVTVNYTNGETAATEAINDNTALITVTEPNLAISKTATLISAAPITGGDIIEYAITVVNNGDATAYDSNLVDTLPAEVQFYGAFTPTALVDGNPVAGFVATPLGVPFGPLHWGSSNGDNSLDIPAGSSLVLTYRVQILTAQPNAILTNQVWVDWTSLENASIYERTGTGCPTITAPDDYCAGPATANVVIADTSTLVKSIISDTYNVAPLSTANDATVRVGDTVTYQLDLNLQEGVTRQVTVQDVLPAGLEFVDVVSINSDTIASYTAPGTGAGSNFSYAAITTASVPAAGATGTLTWTIGDVTNNPLGDATTDTLTIVYRARVVENILAHTPTLTLTNTATLGYIDVYSLLVVDPARLESSAVLTVLQPVMDSLSKIDRAGRTSIAPVNPAFETMNFRLSSCNTTGLAPAYSVQITDTLPTQNDETSIAGPVNGAGQPDVYIGGVLQTAGADYSYTAPAVRGGDMVFRTITPVNPGECIDIDFDIGFYTDFPLNQIWYNNVSLNEYWSLPLLSGQRYPGLGPVQFGMTNAIPQDPPVKTLISPLTGEATIGDEIVYHIAVPGVPTTAALYNVTITDNLDPALVYVSATEISGNGLTLTDNTTLPGAVSLDIATIPAGQQALIELRVRVDNNASANAGTAFDNTASYGYPLVSGGPLINAGSSTVGSPINIVEPLGTLNKAVANLTNPGLPPDAGDVLRYTLTFTTQGGAPGDNFSDAFDLSVEDSLSLGLLYNGNPTVSGAGNTIGAPVTAGNGITVPQTLNWSVANTNAAIDATEGSVVTITYDVLVLDGVQANQALSNSALIRWTGQPGVSANERDGSATPAVNDYFTVPATAIETVPDGNTIAKTRLTDTYGAGDTNVRIGDIVEYELRLNIQEGTSPNMVISDTLPQGLAFTEVVSINGDTAAPYAAVAPFTHAAIAAPTVTGDPMTGPSTVTWTVGDLISAGDNTANNDFVIVYRAVVRNLALPQVASMALNNSATLSYDTATVPGNQIGNQGVTLQQPVLGVSKSALTQFGDTVLVPNELVTYTVDIANTGAGPAYDPVLIDTIPAGLRNAGITMVSTSLVVAGTVLPNLAPVYVPATGVATWNFDTGVADAYTIPAGDTLRVVYRVQADAGIGAGISMTNSAYVYRYYSFDNDAAPTLGITTGVREIYGPTTPAEVTLTTAGPGALSKANPATTTVAVGETFTYRITVPAATVPTALYDVRIIDNLPAGISFVSVSAVGVQPWTPVNTGTVSNLVIEDITTGIDIPANSQIAVDVTVQVLDAPVNVSGRTFTNTADYTYNAFDNDPGTQLPGAGDTTPPMTIVGPDSVTMTKTGPATLAAATPGNFTLDVQNTGSGTAWDLTITDLLPNTANGGMCDVAPIITAVQIYDTLGNPVPPVLTAGVDYVTSFAPAPSCTFTITMQSAAAAIGPNEHVVVNYTAELDASTAYATPLTNITGATEWFSYDTAGAGATAGQRTYTRTITDGTVGTLDHEDAWTLNSEGPTLIFRETVQNLTTATNPAATATPGDLLRYTITVTNGAGLPITDFSLLSDLDLLNGTARFAPGTLNLVTVPGGADVTNTNAAGGTNGSGLLDVRALNLDAAGGANDTLTLEFDVQLGAVIDNGTTVLTQTQLIDNATTIGYSDDPNVNGIDNPVIIGDEDPTQIVITSTPAFEVWKTSTDLTGDPAVLAPGDTLRYTITVKNVGTENAINATLRDLIPANTTYVVNSTTLNGSAVADAGAGISPLEAGMLINAPEDPTPGAMRADANPAVTSNIATVTFDVVVSASAVNGTVISNQGFVNGDGVGSGAFPEEPSDDPDTATIDDPTRDVVGSLPLVDATKTVVISTDGGTIGIVDPGDTLRYTITINNFGATNATGVNFSDAVPANTTYVANSTSLNGIAVADAGVGVSPLIGGIDVSSSDLTPPLPTAGAGVLTAGQNAVVVFDVTVDALTPAGTVISNQGTVNSTEQAAEPTDADGNDSNGDQPTQVVVGSAQQLAISKSVTVVGGGAALPGADLEYVVVVTNIGSLPAADVLITDNLDLPVAGQLTYVAGSGTLNGAVAGVSYAAPIVTADYATTYGDLAVGASATLRFRATIGALPTGTTITNIADVSWNAGGQTASASVSIDVGGIPGVASLSGQAWHDANFDLTAGGAEIPLDGWSVETWRNGTLIGTVVTDANGLYSISGLAPNDTTTDQYELRFRAPGHTTTTAMLGNADSIFTNGLQTISNIIVSSGSITQNMNMPASPDGVVYDSMQRIPIVGATLTMLDATSQTALPSTCFTDTAQQGQVTLADGYYRFDINFSNGSCPAGGTYLLSVAPPASGYTANTSVIIPPQSDGSTAAFDVPACLGTGNDAVPGTPNHCEVVDFETAPPTSIAAGTAGTNYHLHLLLNNTQIPGESQLFNNHIPLDPDLTDSVAITKTAARVTVSRGEMVPYTITLNNNYVLDLNNQSIVDTFPYGFKYVAGSARYDGAPLEPTMTGNTLRWDNIDLASSERHILKLLFIVGAGVSEGDYINRAQIINNLTGSVSSGEATATVRVVPDPTFDCSDVIGKVFDDKNLNGYQDDGEPGLPNARVVSARGLIAKSDEHGRFHITCAATPDESRGANYILKVDERSLPSGYRLTSENPRVQRITRGKMMKFNFGAAIHHVVRIDVADGVFKPASDEMREQWKPRVDLLINELKKSPSLLRITYLGDAEDEDLVDDRLAAVKAMIEEKWDGYPLTIESEIHWRRGGPVGSPDLLD